MPIEAVACRTEDDRKNTSGSLAESMTIYVIPKHRNRCRKG